MSQLNDSTENKKCEKYSRVSVRCVNNTTGGPDKDKGKISFTKTKRNTAKRRERKNVLPLQKSSSDTGDQL